MGAPTGSGCCARRPSHRNSAPVSGRASFPFARWAAPSLSMPPAAPGSTAHARPSTQQSRTRICPGPACGRVAACTGTAHTSIHKCARLPPPPFSIPHHSPNPLCPASHDRSHWIAGEERHGVATPSVAAGAGGEGELTLPGHHALPSCPHMSLPGSRPSSPRSSSSPMGAPRAT